MNYPTKLFLFLAFGAICFAACRKDSFKQDDTIIPPDPLVEISAGVFGLVTDEAGQPVESAIVQLGTSSTITDESGYFSLTGLANQAQPFIRVEKAGYFPSLSSFSVEPGGMGRVKVTLREKTTATIIAANTGGLVNVSGGGAIQFQANSFVTADGQPYAGTVQVYATYLDPSQSQTNSMIPGSYQGRSAQGEAQVLLSYGMLHALLETPSGEKLQLSQPAEITVPVPADRVGTAPAEIPLWAIDESTSIWKEEGKAVLSGGAYKGQVSHFSWWNCDIGFPLITLSGTLRLGSAHPYVGIRITRPNGSHATTTPSSSGFFSGKVPADESLLFEVINECGVVVYSQTIGPYSTDTNLGIISLDWTTDWVEISGTLLDCDQDPVTYGYVSAITNSQGAYPFPISINPTTGEFSTMIANCGGTTVSLTGYDLNALKASPTQTLPISTQVDFGDVVACDNQIVPGMLIEYGGGGSAFIANVSGLYNAGNPGSLNLYEIRVIDEQTPDKAIYTFTFLDWNQDPANPLWAYNYQAQLIGSPNTYEFTGNSAIESIQLGTLPGETVIMKVSGVTVTELPANITHPNSTLTFTAVLQ